MENAHILKVYREVEVIFWSIQLLVSVFLAGSSNVVNYGHFWEANRNSLLMILDLALFEKVYCLQ